MRTLEEAEQLLKDFSNQSLDKKDWTHEAHLTVALLHLKQYNLYDSICRMRSGIILLNKAHGTENTGQKGYHETLTIFWITILHFYVRRFPSLTNTETVNSFLATPLADKSLPFLFYEKEKVLSDRYRASFVSPDKLALNDYAIQGLLVR